MNRESELARRLPSPSLTTALVVLLALLVLTLAVYWKTAAAMAAIWWRSETYTHGFLVPMVSLWLIARRRTSLMGMVPKPSLIAVLGLIPIGVLWLLGDLVAVNAATQFALVATIVLLVPSVLGWQVARSIAFPLLFLFFAVPIGDFLMPLFMIWTADFTVAALRLTGIPVYREGLQFVIPSGNWSVVEACSGIRYLIASVTVGSLYAYLNYQTVFKRTAFVVVSFVVPIVANWLRAYIIVMLGHLSGNTIATGVDHLIYGWVFFGVVIFLMFIIGGRWADAPQNSDIGSAGPAGAPLRAIGAGPASNMLVVLAAILVVWPAGMRWVVLSQRLEQAPVLAAVSPVGGWKRVDGTAAPSWKPAYINARELVPTQFERSGDRVYLWVAYYRSQDYSSKLISSENVLVRADDPLWQRAATGTRTVSWGKQPVVVFESSLVRPVARGFATREGLLVRHVNWVHDRWTVHPAWGKLLGALQLLSGQGDDGAAVFVFTEESERAGGVLDEFLAANGDAILHALRASSKGS